MPTPEHAAFSLHIEMLKSMAAQCAKSYETEKGVEYLYDLKTLAEEIDQAIKIAEKMLINASIEKFGKFVYVKSPNFGLAYARVTETYDVPDDSPFKKDTISRRADNEKIEEYLNMHGELPEGITKKISTSINFKKGKPRPVGQPREKGKK